MATTAALRLGEPIGCSSTDAMIERDDMYTGGNGSDYWASEPSSVPQSPSITVSRHRQSALQQRFKIINEGDIQVCRLNHTRTIVSKIMNSKYLRRWEGHHIILGENEIESTLVSLQMLTCQKILMCFLHEGESPLPPCVPHTVLF